MSTFWLAAKARCLSWSRRATAGWPAVNMLDDAPSSGWASKEGKIADNVFVFEMAAPAFIEAFEFDTMGIDGKGRGAKDVIVEVSATFEGRRLRAAPVRDPRRSEGRPALRGYEDGRGALGAPDPPQQP